MSWLVVLSLPLFTASAAAGAEEIRFVRGGIAVDSPRPVQVSRDGESLTVESLKLAGSLQLVFFDWQPEANYRVDVGGQVYDVRAPQAAEPVAVRRIELEDVSQAVVGGAAPDTIVRFRPDSRHLAIGSFAGWLRIVDCYTGQVIDQRRIAEGITKQLAWSPDGRQLYVGEQSPDAELTALAFERVSSSADGNDTWQVRRRWRVRLADELESSRPPANDRFGIYTLPSVSDIQIADDGRVFVAGWHSWSDRGRMQNRGMIYCFAPDGKLLWRFPEGKPLRMTIAHIAVDPKGRKLLFMPMQTQQDAPEAAIRPGTLYLLDANSGQLSGRYRPEPLRPHFADVESWDSVSLSHDSAHAAVGLADGRVFLFDSSDGALSFEKQFDLGTPVLVGNVPIGAPASYTRFFGQRLYLQTQSTYIPFGSTLASQQAPTSHHGANTLTAADRDGRLLWRYRGPFVLGGSSADRSGAGRQPRWLAVNCGQPSGTDEPGQFGFLLFDLVRQGGGGERLLYYYPTEGPVIARADLSPDGRFTAAVESPAIGPDRQDIYGTYQVHVVH